MGSFNKSQTAEIYEGAARGVDTSIYAHSKYNSFQMREIRLGLEEGLNVSIYTDKKYDWKKMAEMRRSLEKSRVNEQDRPVVQLNKSTGKGLER